MGWCLTAKWNRPENKRRMEVIWKSYGSPKAPKMVTRLVLEAYGTHMEIHMEIIFPCLMLLTSIWNHIQVIWKSYGSPNQKYVTRLVLETYGTHMEIHLEIINQCLMLLTSIWN